MSDLVSQNLNMIFKSPKGETVHALKDLNFTIKIGELLTVLGPSGCGKTTLLNILSGNDTQSEGALEYDRAEFQRSWLGKTKVPDEIYFAGCHNYNKSQIVKTYIDFCFPNKSNRIFLVCFSFDRL